MQQFMYLKELRLWVARTPVQYTEDNEHYIERHPEKEYQFTKLYIVYDKPEAHGNVVTNWESFRKMSEAPNYMFPEIKPGTFMEFTSLVGKQERFIEMFNELYGTK